jgi:hypothetical protein
MRLERYIIADDAVLEDIADEWQLWHHIGGAAGGEPRAESLEYENGRLIKTTRFGLSGYDLWLPASSALPSDLSPQLPASDAETFRILQRIPAWPSELNTDTFPQGLLHRPGDTLPHKDHRKDATRAHRLGNRRRRRSDRWKSPPSR